MKEKNNIIEQLETEYPEIANEFQNILILTKDLQER